MSQNDWRISLEFISVYLLEILHHLFHLKMQMKNYHDQFIICSLKITTIFGSTYDTDETSIPYEHSKIIEFCEFFEFFDISVRSGRLFLFLCVLRDRLYLLQIQRV